MVQKVKRAQHLASLWGALLIILLVAAAAFVFFNRSVPNIEIERGIDHVGPITEPQDWPDHLGELLAKASDDQIESLQVYRMFESDSAEYVWRIDHSGELLDNLKLRFDLKRERGQANWPILMGKSRFSEVTLPPWWSPPRTPEVERFSSPQGNPLGEGVCVQAMFDPTSQTLYVYYVFEQ
jgi:hypothetical protein